MLWTSIIMGFLLRPSRESIQTAKYVCQMVRPIKLVPDNIAPKKKGKKNERALSYECGNGLKKSRLEHCCWLIE